MSKIDPNKLLISSHFYSIQCEGITTGIPSYFIRLTNCNLSCGASAKFINELKKQEDIPEAGSFQGDLHKEGKANWTCDTISQWIRGKEYEFQEIIDIWKKQGLYERIQRGEIHIIWTGGEPTIPQHQESIYNFYNYWMRLVNYEIGEKITKSSEFNPYFEIETNGTCYIDDKIFYIFDQINCSPKLSNSGMSENKRIIRTAIERIMKHDNYHFKFVISNEEDIKEIFDTFIKPFNIPIKNVVCMPGLDDRKDFHERTKFCLEMAKEYGFRGMTRLHISAWDKTVDV